MTTTIKLTVASLSIAAIALFAAVVPAQAISLSDLDDYIALGFSAEWLMNNIDELGGGNGNGGNTGGTCGVTTYGYTATSTLKSGMNGAAVSALQTALNNYGGASVVVDGAYGPATKGAVMAFQASKGLSQDGVAGPVTQGALQNASAMTGNCDNGGDNGNGGNNDLNGDFGTINALDTLSQYSGEEVGEGQDDVVVLGMEIEADSDGDIMIQALKVSFDSTGNTGSDNLDDYISEVTVWFDGDQVGSADVDNFSENGAIFSKTIALDSGVIIEADQKEKITVAVSAANTFDSSDISGDSWTVGVDNVRFVDGSGVVTTDATVGDLPISGTTIDFVSYSAAADTELKISTDSDSPEADVVIVNDSSSTDDVVLLKGKLKLEGTSDAVLDEFPVTFSPVGANINVIAESLKLVIDGEEYTESVPSIADGASASVTFDNLDFDIMAGDTVKFTVLADITDLDGTVFAEGDSIEADVTASNRDLMDIENEEGDQLSDASEKSGTANGEAQEFRTEGIMIELVSTSTDVTAGTSANDDLGEFIIKYKVKAVGNAIYVSSLATASLTATGNGTVVGVERSGTATIGGVSVTVVNTTDDTLTSVGNFLIEEGEEETFEMTATVQLPTAGLAGQYRALIRAIDWATTDTTTYTSYESNLDSYKTSYKALN